MHRCDPTRPPACARRTSRVLRSGAVASFRARAAALILPLLATLAVAGPPPGHRSFPANALRGELLFGAAPLAVLNGHADRLAPGARIRGEDHMLRLPASLVGQTLVVHYTREPSSGLLMDVWILNRAEWANQPWPSTPAEAASWRFDPASQRWSR
ncbi:MAG: hypothetical protein ACOVN7_00640 [Rubrivivax sp.]|jgi:hypothetical protein